MIQPYIVFTDLDGTLLDYSSYSFEPAVPALKYLKEIQIPLILVSSKTRSELEYYQKKIGISGLPFVVENGSAIYSSLSFFKNIYGFKSYGDYFRNCLGETYSVLKSILERISLEYNYQIQGFHNASVEEIRERTGLSENELAMAIDREFSIPLFFDRKAEEILRKEIDKYQLQLLYGGRFMHFLSKVSKGQALQIILEGYRHFYNRTDIKSIALGDSQNDLDMLARADLAVLVKKQDGSYQACDTCTNVIYSPGTGPEGWNEAILNILQNGGKNE